jgi:parallel beta-helix repeat protein
MKRKMVSAVTLTLLLISMLTLAFNIQPVKASGTIYIRADGSIDPPTAPIQRNGDIYTLTDNISSDADGIVIERNNMTLDGAGYTLQGARAGSGKGVDLSQRSNVTLKNTKLTGFLAGIYLKNSSGNMICDNYACFNDGIPPGPYSRGINLEYSDNNSLLRNIASNNDVGDGIYLSYSNDNVITYNNACSNNDYGIFLSCCSNNILDGNSFFKNMYGIHLDDSNSNLLTRNNASNNRDGIQLWTSCNNAIINNSASNKEMWFSSGIRLDYSSNNNMLLGNSLLSNNLYGISLANSCNSTLSGNIMANNRYNFGVTGSTSSHFHNTVDSSNMVNGKPIYYVRSASNTIYDSSTKASTIYIIDSINVTLRDLTLTKNYRGVFFWNTSNSKIENVTATINFNGVEFSYSRNNTLFGNNFTNNSNCGVALHYSESNNIIGNTIENDTSYGIYLDKSGRSIFRNNDLAGNGVNIGFQWTNVSDFIQDIDSSNTIDGKLVYYLVKRKNLVVDALACPNAGYFGLVNSTNVIVRDLSLTKPSQVALFAYVTESTIYHNDFNNVQVISSFGNAWDNGYPSGGNHWSNYIGKDLYHGQYQNETGSDGIGDSPFVINENNTDRYPLIISKATTITVPDDYPTIQEAINNANKGDTIFVRNGTYYEHVVVSKTVSLIGENKFNALIDGNGTGNVVTIRADGVIVTGFTIENGNSSMGSRASGIYVDYTDGYGSSYWLIYNNIIVNSEYGIRGSRFYRNGTICDNIIKNNTEGGILLARINYFCSILNNVLTDNGYGIALFECINGSIIGNTISNSWTGIMTSSCNNCSLFHNNFINNTYQAWSDLDTTSTWDNGYPSGGNYWSDYKGTDLFSGPYQNITGSDGIGDKPYVIDANNRDRYPLMNPYGPPPPLTYAFTITAKAGGTTNPAPGAHIYTANQTAQVTAIPEANYLFDYWELDSVNVGSANPYSVYMDKNHILKAVFSPIPPPLSASISPLSVSILVGQSVTFTATVSGGYTPYSYQWYLNGNPVSGATSASWTFTPTTSGIYYVHLQVTDAKGNTAQSETARIAVTAVPVGGYSFPIQVQTKAEPVLPYIALIAILTAIFTKLRPKTKRKR